MTGIGIVDETFPTIHAPTPIFPATLLFISFKKGLGGWKGIRGATDMALRRAIVGLVVGTSLAWSIPEPADAQLVVETMTANVRVEVVLPGTPSGSGTDFTGSLIFTSVNFTPGTVTFAGMPVDFSGTEASWLAVTHPATIHIPVTTDPGQPNRSERVRLGQLPQ